MPKFIYSPFLLLIILLLSANANIAYAQHNPFLRQSPKTTEKAQTAENANTENQKIEKKSPEPRKYNLREILNQHIPFLNDIIEVQRVFVSKISKSLKAFRSETSFLSILLFLLFSLIYGIIHSLGPGHAKVLLSSHTIAHSPPLKKVWIAGGVFTFTHIGSAIIVFFVLKKLFVQSAATINQTTDNMLHASGYLITFIGLLMLANLIKEKFFEKKHDGNSKHTTKSLNALAFSAGLVPCPGTLLILTFSNMLGVLFWGFASVIFISLGMCFTVSTIASIGSKISEKVNNASNNKIYSKIHLSINILAPLIIIFLGIGFILQ